MLSLPHITHHLTLTHLVRRLLGSHHQLLLDRLPKRSHRYLDSLWRRNRSSAHDLTCVPSTSFRACSTSIQSIRSSDSRAATRLRNRASTSPLLRISVHACPAAMFWTSKKTSNSGRLNWLSC